MKAKFLLVTVSLITFTFGIWVKDPNRSVKSEQSIQADHINQAEPIKKEISLALIQKHEKSKKNTDYNKIENNQEPAYPLKIDEEIFNLEGIFTGNSNYTGDDTEDNDAGNLGFEDDFPEAEFAYDDHAAEGYINYTESYSN